MSSCQGEAGTPLVVEERWLPLGRVVALGTRRDAVSVCELLPVNVFVTVFALRRSSLEVHIEQFRFKIRRLVTVDAGCRPMSPEQRKLRL